MKQLCFGQSSHLSQYRMATWNWSGFKTKFRRSEEAEPESDMDNRIGRGFHPSSSTDIKRLVTRWWRSEVVMLIKETFQLSVEVLTRHLKSHWGQFWMVELHLLSSVWCWCPSDILKCFFVHDDSANKLLSLVTQSGAWRDLPSKCRMPLQAACSHFTWEQLFRGRKTDHVFYDFAVVSVVRGWRNRLFLVFKMMSKMMMMIEWTECVCTVLLNDETHHDHRVRALCFLSVSVIASHSFSWQHPPFGNRIPAQSCQRILIRLHLWATKKNKRLNY